MRVTKYLNTLKNKAVLQESIISASNIFLILLVLNILSLNLGMFEQSFMVILSFYVLIALLIFNLPLKKIILIIKKKNSGKFEKIILGIAIIFLSFILLLLTTYEIIWIISIPIFIVGLDQLLDGIDKRRQELNLLSIIAFIYALFFIFIHTISVLWSITTWFSLSVSDTIGSFINKPLLLGPSVSGLWIVISFIILLSVCYVIPTSNKQRKLFWFLITIVVLLLIWIFYIMLISSIEFELKSDVVNLHFFLFILCFVPTFFYLTKYKRKESTIPIQKMKKIQLKTVLKNTSCLSLIFLFLSLVTLTSFIGVNTSESSNQNILFYGQNMLGTWDIPEYGKYGREASGMFGLLPIYLTQSNYKSKIVVNNITQFLNVTQPTHENITRFVNLTDYISIEESSQITNEILKDVDIFVVVSINQSFSSDEIDRIWDFVEKGGSLLVLGDHTNVGGIQDPLNDLLSPVNIQFRFDSSLPLDSTFKWLTCYQVFHHPSTLKITSYDELQISVGASLDISASSFPVVIGRYALSDGGEPLNEEMAYLGDYEYNLGEQLGDIILVAGSYYGQGKVLVFGDTSSFQNSAIAYSYPLIQSVFTWLNSNQTGDGVFLQLNIMLLFLILALLSYKIQKKNRISFMVFPLILALSVLISYSINPMVIDDSILHGNIVYIDTSHGERFNQELFTDNSVNGLILNLNRNDYFPLLMKDFSKGKILESKILFLIAPTKTFTEAEVEFLKKYMFNGGIVVLSTGYEDKAASLPLLNELGLNVEGIPLGPVPYVEENPEEFENEPRFVDSWPIRFSDQTIRSYYNFSWDIDYHLMVFVEYGKGGLLGISDSRFLLDENIESIYDYWPGNIIFLKHILDDFKAREVHK
jgi:hypothetical protein